MTRLRVRPLPLVAAIVMALPATAPAAPTVGRIVPPGGPRGATVDVEITGGDLAETRELRFEEPGITVERLETAGDRQVKAVLRVAGDCPTGPRRFRIRTRDGLSELRTFRVGLLEQERETEPNDEPATAQPVVAPRTIAGVVRSEDVDCFRVHLAAGARLAVAIDAIRLDQSLFDPHVEIVDGRGFVVAACDDHPLLGQDAMLAATAAEEGDFIVRVRESAYGGSDGSVYLLHLGDFPVPHLAWPPAGPPGGEIDVEWLGDPAGPFRQRITLPVGSDPAGVAEIHPVRAGVAGPVAVPLRVCPLGGAAEAEPNDAPARATPAPAPGGLVGRLGGPGDVDWFRVAAEKGSRWFVRAWGRRLGSPVDLVVNVHRDNDKRERLTGNDDDVGPDSAVEVTVPEEGGLLVRVNDHRQRGGDDFVYWIDLEAAPPGVDLAVPPARANSQDGLAAVVPRGNRTALLLNATRSSFGGPARVAFDGLPAGVRVAAADVAAGAPATIAVFEAAADAAEGLALAPVAVTAAEDGRPLGGLRQTTGLVFGPPNNAVYRAVHTDRLPVAVVDQAPIRIELEQPTVPIVRRGSLDLRVRVERLDGRPGKVRLFLPFRPPGIGGPTTVEIREDATEAVYPVSANAEAALGEWQVAVTGRFQPKEKGRGDGEMPVSSGLVTLRVAEPMIELAAEPTTVEQGRETTIVWKVRKPGGFSGQARARLLGLPARTEAPELEFAADATDVSFPVRVAADAPAGGHKNVFCEIRVPWGESWIVQATPPTQLRIDKPLPPDVDETKGGPP